jgi:carboxylate-amine ligase
MQDRTAKEKALELTFLPSPEPSLGVEVELQIVDAETGDLIPAAPRLLKACAEESLTGVTAELMQSMIEAKTGICQNLREVREQLFPILARLRNIATSLGYDLALGGTHPFHRPATGAVFPAERYERLADRLAWMTYQRVVFGLHVHVGIASGDQAIAVMNMLVPYLPHLLALSASSPFWQGVDTGLASCRAALYRLLPHAGVPRYFGTWKEFRHFCQVMRDCRTIESVRDIHWDIRPRPDLGTIEVRICDMPHTLTRTLALVALTRALVVAAQRSLAERPQLRRDIRHHWIAVENKWLATRYGLAAAYIRTPSGKRRALAHDLAELIKRLLPLAREIGDDRFLVPLLAATPIESGAERQRRLYRDTGSWRAVMETMTRQWPEELVSPAPG